MAKQSDGKQPTVSTVTKTFRWSASHWLAQVPEGHKCARLHGHNYEATVSVVGPVDPATGMVVDYGDLSATVGKWIATNWDHRHLGPEDLYRASELPERLPDDPPPFAKAVFPHEPTAENLALYLLTLARTLLPLHTVISVVIRETDGTSAVAS